MAKKKIKLRAKLSGDTVTVKALMSHPMETGQRKNKKTGKLIPAHHITEIHCTHNENTVLDANWGAAISKNPYMSFKFTNAAKGDTVGLAYTDNKGNKASASTKIK
jgi:sulfur-oxidizing protein SoxZ